MVYERIREEWSHEYSGILPEYPQSIMLYGRMPNPSDKNVIDVGCGKLDQWVEILKKCKNTRLVGCDISSVFLRRAALYKRWIEESGNNKVDLILRESERIPFTDNSFDMSVAIEEIVYSGREAEQETREIGRVAKSGGDVVMTFSHKDLWKNLPKDKIDEINKRYHVPVIDRNVATFEDGTEYAVFDENGVVSLLKGAGLKPVTMKTYTLKELDSKDCLLPLESKSTIYVESKKI